MNNNDVTIDDLLADDIIANNDEDIQVDEIVNGNGLSIVDDYIDGIVNESYSGGESIFDTGSNEILNVLSDIIASCELGNDLSVNNGDDECDTTIDVSAIDLADEFAFSYNTGCYDNDDAVLDNPTSKNYGTSTYDSIFNA